MSKTRRAFTLIEVIATTLLATLLMLAVLACIPALSRAPSADVVAQPSHDVLRLLRWDLGNARRFESTSARMTLWGFNAMDSSTLAPTHRAAAITYRVETIDGIPWLIRSQMTETGSAAQLICSHVAALTLAALADRGMSGAVDLTSPATQPATRPVGGEFDQGPGKPLSRRMEVRMISDTGAVEFDRVICMQ